MRDGDWQLVYAGTDLTFGTVPTGIENVTAPDLGDVALTVADADRPRMDGRSFGQDYRGARTIAFDLRLVASSEVEVRALLERVQTAWRADNVRRTPGAVVQLVSQYRGVRRVVFGRPRRFAAVVQNAHAGQIEVTADFACEDDLFYGADEEAEEISITPSTGGGFTVPMTWPMTFATPATRSRGITITSPLPVRPRVEITGPISQPVVEITGALRLAFNVDLKFDETLVLDARALTITKNGTPAAGTITRDSTRLSAVELAPGNYPLTLRGSSASGTATARVSWRTTSTTP